MAFEKVRSRMTLPNSSSSGRAVCPLNSWYASSTSKNPGAAEASSRSASNGSSCPVGFMRVRDEDQRGLLGFDSPDELLNVVGEVIAQDHRRGLAAREPDRPGVHGKTRGRIQGATPGAGGGERDQLEHVVPAVSERDPLRRPIGETGDGLPDFRDSRGRDTAGRPCRRPLPPSRRGTPSGSGQRLSFQSR